MTGFQSNKPLNPFSKIKQVKQAVSEADIQRRLNFRKRSIKTPAKIVQKPFDFRPPKQPQLDSFEVKLFN